MRMGTRVTRAGLPPSTQGAPFLPGPTFAGPYHAAGDPASAPLTYGRFHNPTWSAYEQALSELEGGPAVIFASGMAAVAARLDSEPRRPALVHIDPFDRHARAPGGYSALELADEHGVRVGALRELGLSQAAGEPELAQVRSEDFAPLLGRISHGRRLLTIRD